jgi:Rps23 Pro-64 3,4-dihydroxylase Tpa1-like proline 4-hydroxylase
MFFAITFKYVESPLNTIVFYLVHLTLEVSQISSLFEKQKLSVNPNKFGWLKEKADIN